MPDNDPAKNVFYWKDRDAMARSAGLRATAEIAPVFIDADATPNLGGYPIGGVTLIDLPNSHLQYARYLVRPRRGAGRHHGCRVVAARSSFVILGKRSEAESNPIDRRYA